VIFSELRNGGPDGSDVVAAHGAVRDAQGQVGAALTSSNEEEEEEEEEEEAGEPFSIGCPL
jgi:ribosomal protein L12E/L44/L45/RPP1/RPP2